MGIETDIPNWLRETVPQSHYPRRPTEDELKANAALEAERDLFPELDRLYAVLVDMPGMLRINVELTPVFTQSDGSLSFGRYVPRTERTKHSEDGGFFQEDNFSITTWGEYMERVLTPVTNALARPSIQGAVIVIDGPAPRAKEIHYNNHRYKYKRGRAQPIIRDTRPGAPPRFSAQSPIYNKVDDILMDQEAKREFQEFFSTYVFTTYVQSAALPVGKCVVMHGGRYNGRVLEHPLMALRSSEHVVSVVDYDGRLGANPRAPMYFVSSEADISINSWLNHLPTDRDIAVISKDGDVELLLLSRLQDRVREGGDLALLGKLWLRRSRAVGQEDATSESTPLFSMPDPLLDDDDDENTVTALHDEPTASTAEHGGGSDADDEEDANDNDSSFVPSSLSVSTAGTSAVDDEDKDPLLQSALAASTSKKRKAPPPAGPPMPKRPRRRAIREIEWVDVNCLYTRLFLLFDGLQQSLPARDRCHPIELFLMLSFLRKNDYMDRLPGLTFKPLMAFFLEEGYKVGKLLMSTQMRVRRGCERFDDLHRVRLYRIHYPHLELLLLRAYRRKFGVNTEAKWRTKMKAKIAKDVKKQLNVVNYKGLNSVEKKTKMAQVKAAVDVRVKALRYDETEFDTLPKLRSWLSKHEPGTADKHPPENLRVTAANLAWVLNYYTQGGKADFQLQNEFAVSDERSHASLHGYCLTPSNDVVRAKEVVMKTVY